MFVYQSLILNNTHANNNIPRSGGIEITICNRRQLRQNAASKANVILPKLRKKLITTPAKTRFEGPVNSLPGL